MAGGEGTRLNPLTSERSKPSVAFGGRYRIVDFVLSNLINSKICSIYLLVQYKSQSLIEHVRKSWVLSPIMPQHFVTVVPPQMQEGPEWFQGTADAVYQSLSLIDLHQPDIVVVFGADHLYRMDVRQMIRFHQANEADVTIAALPVPIEQASAFGVISTASDGRVKAFEEKPAQPSPMPDDPTRAFASMGNYLFNTEVLVEALEEARREQRRDFGHDVLPRLIDSRRLLAYNFATNRIPGIKPYEEPGYWRDLGTIEAYFEAHQDILGLEPRFELFNEAWPIISSNYQGPPIKVIHGDIHNSVFVGGTIVKNATVRNSIIRRQVTLEDDVELDECIVMDYVTIKRGARLRKTIVGLYNTIDSGERIGYDLEGDAARYTVTPSGIVVIPDARPR
jgi:glucose-1-phosphate adenylyltransferase